MAYKVQNIVILILLILLFFSVGYIVAEKLQEKKQKELAETFQQGIRAGYENAVLSMMQRASSCQSVSLYANNQTMELIDVGCLQLLNKSSFK
jgi:hypothetical protein